ncbi:MAG: DUF2213 domain-containing protein [Chloroflexi bacterium]|nr:DUF2213 domain-containing protein [Chloroflexota bacterium]
MPLPERREGETKTDYIDRCMSDPQAVKDFADRDQRFAVCSGLADNSQDDGLWRPGSTENTMITNMVHIEANMSALVRTDTFEGKEHWVIPFIALKGNVIMNDLFYPQAEVDKYPEAWNGIPLPVFHPTKDGENVSANDPTMIEERSVGRTFNCMIEDGKLKGEAWVDKEKCRAISNELAEMIENGDPIEISTGLFPDYDGKAGTFDGNWYKSSVFNYRPDHLALLPGGVGAMNWKDGAGMPRVNKQDGTNQEGEDDEMTILERMRRMSANAHISHSDLWMLINTKVKDERGATAFVIDVFDEFFIYDIDSADGMQVFQQAYTETESNVTFSGDPVAVRRQTEFVPITNESDNAIGGAQNKQGKATNKEGESMDRTVLINALIANEASDWAEEDREGLVAMSDEDFGGVTVNKPAADADGDDGDGTTDGADKGKVTPAAGTPAVADPTPDPAPATNTKPMTLNELIESCGDPALKGTLTRAVARDSEIQSNMVKDLLEIKDSPFTANDLKDKSIEELGKYLKLAGSLKEANDYSAQAVAVVDNVDDSDVPDMPRMSWKKD